MRNTTYACAAVCLAMLILQGAAPPCAAHGVGGLGAPTAQDALENNLNALRGPSPGAPQRVGPLTPQQSLDGNIGGLRSSGPVRNAPTPQYYPPVSARSNHHPGADALLYGTQATVAPLSEPHRRPARRKRPRRS